MRRSGATLARGRSLLVGDAAGLVDPFSGDGMFEAFRSAELAAGAVLELLEGKRSALDGYSGELARALDPLTVVAWTAKRLVERFPQLPFAAPWRRPVFRLIGAFVRGDVLATEGSVATRLCHRVGRYGAGRHWALPA
jgi:flavin-dependent dehydrogenase